MKTLLWVIRGLVVVSAAATVWAFIQIWFWLFWVGLAVLVCAVVADHCIGWSEAEHEREQWLRKYRDAVWNRREGEHRH